MASPEKSSPTQPETPIDLDAARQKLIDDGTIVPEVEPIQSDSSENPSPVEDSEDVYFPGDNEVVDTPEANEESDASELAEVIEVEQEPETSDEEAVEAQESATTEVSDAPANAEHAPLTEQLKQEWAKYLVSNDLLPKISDIVNKDRDAFVNADRDAFVNAGGNVDEWSTSHLKEASLDEWRKSHLKEARRKALIELEVITEEEVTSGDFDDRKVYKITQAGYDLKRQLNEAERAARSQPNETTPATSPNGDEVAPKATTAPAGQPKRTDQENRRSKKRESLDDIAARLEANLGETRGATAAEEEPATPGSAEQSADELEAAWRKLVAEYGRQPSNGPERAEIARKAKAAKEKLDALRSDPEGLKTKLAEARANWQRDVQELGRRMGDTSPEANELRQKVKAGYAEVQSLEQQIWDKLVSDNTPKPDTEPATGESESESGNDNEGSAEGPSRDELSAYTNVLEAQYNAIEDKDSEEAVAILKSWREAYAQYESMAPEEPARPPETDEQKAARLQEIMATITSELDGGTYAETLKVALGKYAELKADAETKGRFGRHRIERDLKAAEAELTNAKIEYERELIKKKHEAGLYEGEPSEVSEQCANELFDSLRSIDKDTREATDAVHETRLNERGRVKRAVAAVGRWLTGGGKVAQIVRPGGVGFVTGFGIAMSGAAWPITTAVGIGIGLGVRGAATRANLDKAHVENKGKLAVDDAKLAEIRERVSASTEDVIKRAKGITGNILNESTKASYEIAKQARKRTGKVALAFAGGAGLGALTGIGAHMAYDAFTAHGTNAPVNPEVPKAPADKPPVTPTGGSPEAALHGEKFFVESGHGPIKEIQEAASANGHNISMGRAEDIYNHLYSQYGDKLVNGGPEYHGSTGDLRFGESGSYKWGNGVLDKIVSMSGK